MKYYRVLRGVVAIVGLVVLVLGINISQMLSLVLLVFGRAPFMRFNIGCQGLFAYANALAVKWCGNEIIISGDAPSDEDAIVMANHQSVIDIPLLWVWGLPTRRNGKMKWFVKDSFKYIPGPGWGLKFTHALYVKRNWAKDVDSIRKTFKILREGDIPFWVVIFPEGTRLNPKKLAVSQAYAERKKLERYNKVLTPRPKGVWASVQGLKGKLQAIYDVSISYESSDVPTVGKFYCEGGCRVYIHATRIPIGEIPTIERDFNQWMMKRFMDKDVWVDQMHRELGSVP